MRTVLLITHAGRAEARKASRRLARSLNARGIEVQVPQEEFDELDGLTRDAGQAPVVHPISSPNPEVELIVVVGGDGTILRASEFAYDAGIPLLGMNLGHVGFLAEVESDAVGAVVDSVVERTYRVEERLVLRVRTWRGSTMTWESFAVNEAAIEKRDAQRMIDLLLEIDQRPLSRWGCDGVIVATPTGSTAYSWSAGGPVVWPAVRALLVSPIGAHALFARPLVVDPGGEVALEVGPKSPEAVIWVDGQRTTNLAAGDRVEITAAGHFLRFARMHEADFTDRLVAKFRLPVDGWRGRQV